MKRVFNYCIVHSMKVAYGICILLAFLVSFGEGPFMADYNWFLRFLGLSGVLILTRFIFGGWNASSLKWMVWSAILSTVAGVGLVIIGMKSSGNGISFWICCIPVILAVISGIWAARYIEDLIENGTEIDENALIDSVFDNGLKNTWNALLGEFEDDFYFAYSRGVAIYSNVCILTGIILYFIYL